MTWQNPDSDGSDKILAMIVSFRYVLGWMVSAFRCREDLVLENLALRQQLLALHAKRPRRRLTALHKLFWVVLRSLWSEWERSLILVTPRTVVGWHRAGFQLYWTWVSRARRVGGRKRVSKEVRTLIFRMAAENPTWGATRIHGELLKLGFNLSGNHGLTMASANPENSRSRRTLADIPKEPSRGDCSHGFLHRTDAHVWRSVLLLCHRP